MPSLPRNCKEIHKLNILYTNNILRLSAGSSKLTSALKTLPQSISLGSHASQHHCDREKLLPKRLQLCLMEEESVGVLPSGVGR